MNKILKRWAYVAGMGAALILGACEDDIDPLVENLDLNRVLTPLELEARVQNRTEVKLNWARSIDAEKYVVEIHEDSLKFEHLVKTEEVLPTDILIVKGLEGETLYSVRIKGVREKKEDSKWATLTFKTEAENIFQKLGDDDLKATEVTLRWTAGATATNVVVNPGNITHTLTAEELAAGKVTITGLTGETEYTAKLMNGTKTRGTMTFTTLIDLGGAIQVNPGDDLAALITAAEEGDVFALMPGEYSIPTLKVEKSVSVKGARPTDKPVLLGTIIRVSAGAGLNLKDVVLDGTGSTGDQAIVYDADGEYGALNLEGCTIRKYTKGTLYVNKNCLLESVLITNCIYYDIECDGGDFIDFRKGIAKTFTYTNNTAYNSAAGRDFFRMDDGGSTNFPGVTSIIRIENNTFYNVTNNNSKRILYIRLKGKNEIFFNRNILAATQGYYSNQTNTKVVEMLNNNYFNAPNFTASEVNNAINDKTGTDTSLDPGFADPEKGDFTVSNEDLIVKGIGDPRWLK